MTQERAEHYINRELSWLEFNSRVLEESQDSQNPLLERLKFLCIVSSNLDEFFEVRVAGLKQQIESEVVERGQDGRTPSETLREASQRMREMVHGQYQTWSQSIQPELAAAGIQFMRFSELRQEELEWVDQFYFEEVASVLTPLGIDPAHPFPELLNNCLLYTSPSPRD